MKEELRRLREWFDGGLACSEKVLAKSNPVVPSKRSSSVNGIRADRNSSCMARDAICEFGRGYQENDCEVRVDEGLDFK